MSKSTSKEPEKVEKDAPQEEPVVEETALAEVTETGTDIEAFSDEEDFDSEDSLTFSNGVIEKIVAIAMREVPGVVGMKGTWFNRVQDAFGASDSTKGVTVEVTPESAVRVNISVLIEYGAYAPQVFEDVKKKAVVKQVTGMTGLEVAGVNLRIEDVLTPEEIEQRSRRAAAASKKEEKARGRRRVAPGRAFCQLGTCYFVQTKASARNNTSPIGRRPYYLVRGALACGKGEQRLDVAAHHALDVLGGVERHVRRHDDVGQRHERGAVAAREHVAAAVEVVEPRLVLDGVERGAAQMPGLEGASSSAAVSTRLPRAAFTSTAPSRMRASSFAPIMWRFSGRPGGVQCHPRRTRRAARAGLRRWRARRARPSRPGRTRGRDSQSPAARAPRTSRWHRFPPRRPCSFRATADLALEREVLRRGAPLDEFDLAQRHEHQHDCVVGHALGRVGGVRHANPQLAGMLDVDVVVADRAGGDAADPELVVAVQQLWRHGIGDDCRGRRPLQRGQRSRAWGSRASSRTQSRARGLARRDSPARRRAAARRRRSSCSSPSSVNWGRVISCRRFGNRFLYNLSQTVCTK